MPENVSTDGVENIDAEIDAGTPYFAVSSFKLVVMSVCTFSLYELYWFYKNWRLVQAREKTDISPMLRSYFFPYFFCHSLFCKIRDSARNNSIKDPLAAGPLAAGWIVLNLLSGLPHYYGLLSFLSVVFFVPVQNAVNKINGAVAPQHDANSKFTGENIAAIVVGVVFFLVFMHFDIWA